MISEQPTSTIFGQLGLPERNPDLGDLKLNRSIAGFLAAYSGPTLTAYRLDLRQWIAWLGGFNTDPFAVERAHIELFARTCEEQGKARSNDRATSVDDLRVLSVLRARTNHRTRPWRPCSTTEQDYESTTLAVRPQRTRGFPRPSRSERRSRSCARIIVGTQWSADLRSARRRHRRVSSTTGDTEPCHPSQRPQDSDHPAGSENVSCSRPLRRRT